MFLNILSLLLYFWLCHPALYYGMAFLLGIFCHFTSSFLLLFPCICLWLPFLIAITYPSHTHFFKHLSLNLFVFFTAWMTTALYYTYPTLPSEGINGEAYVVIRQIRLQHSPFGERWIYQCELKQFIPEHHYHSIASSLPCVISLPAHGKTRPLAIQDYWVKGKLYQIDERNYRLKKTSKIPWKKIENSNSWAEKRYQLKKKLSQWIKFHFTHPSTGSFLAGLATGEFDEDWMKQEFGRFGLQHLLAISGFHFAIIASFLNFILSLFLIPKIRTIILLICLGMYCCFLGPQASILRAWIMCSLTLIGSLIHRQTLALNSLGCALLCILAYNPFLCLELGFQLSFATTMAILLFYQSSQNYLNKILPKRYLSEVLHLNVWNQYAYCLLSFLRQGLALTLAVNIFAFPLTLYYFHQFPWLSLLYNLFFPFFATLSLCLLLLGAFLTFVPFLANFLHYLNDHYTHFLLQMTYQIPTELDAYAHVDNFQLHFLIIYLCLTFMGGIVWSQYRDQENQKDFFSFI